MKGVEMSKKKLEDRGLHLTKNKDGELKSKFIWNTNPLDSIRSTLEKDLSFNDDEEVTDGSEDIYEGRIEFAQQVTMVCFQNIDVLEYASQKYNIDWKKLQLEFYAKQGWIEGEYINE